MRDAAPEAGSRPPSAPSGGGAPDGVAALLRTCEETGLAPPYGAPLLSLGSGGTAVHVVSDLHLAAGRGPGGRIDRLENFFADDAFVRFVHHASRESGPGALLVLNGDVVDFLRIKSLPDGPAALREWADRLAAVGLPRTPGDLQASITEKERTFGLKTHEEKSVWRLRAALDGHVVFFDALAAWLASGRRLVVVKGNHDLEWFWPGVRNTLRLALAERLASKTGSLLGETLSRSVLPRLAFADGAVLIDREVYVEHGHRFDHFSHVIGPPTLAGGKELNIPFGAFFNRYLLDQLETTYPYLDNIRPRENLLPILLRESLPLALKVFFRHIPFVLRVLPKRYWRYVLRRFLPLFLVLVVSLGLLAWLLWPQITAGTQGLPSGDLRGWLLSLLLKPLGVGALSYALGRFIAYCQLEEPDSLWEFARKILRENPDYRVVVVGHTHNPDEGPAEDGTRRFANTGTWIPVVETSTAALREDRTYSFLRLDPRDGHLVPSPLRRWNDDAGRAETMPVLAPAPASGDAT